MNRRGGVARQSRRGQDLDRPGRSGTLTMETSPSLPVTNQVYPAGGALMTESPGLREVSFFRLAEQYDKMARVRRTRWRDRRDTLPARRRRRRARRRTHPADADYYPMEVDGGEANRGVRARLLGAVGAASLTAICLIAVISAPVFTLATVFALTVAIGSLGLSVSLAVSARDEEIVHEMAGRLNAEIANDPPRLPLHELDDGELMNIPTTHLTIDGLEDGELEWSTRRCDRRESTY
jgi:hypothetical protein